MELPRTVGQWWAIIIDVAHEMATALAHDLGPLPLEPPVIDGLKEGLDLVFLLEFELGFVDLVERESTLVASLKIVIWRIESKGAQIEVSTTFHTAASCM